MQQHHIAETQRHLAYALRDALALAADSQQIDVEAVVEGQFLGRPADQAGVGADYGLDDRFEDSF